MVPLPLLKCLHAVKRVNFHWSDATCQSADRVVFLVGRAVSDKATKRLRHVPAHGATLRRLRNQPPPHVARYVAFSSSLIPVTGTPIRA